MLESELNPLYLEILERGHQLSTELGWASYRAMFEELKGVDLGRLAMQTRAFKETTDATYRAVVEPQLVTETGLGFDRLQALGLSLLLPGEDTRFPLPLREAGRGAREDTRGPGLRSGEPVQRDAGPRTAAEEERPCLLRSRARAQRGLSRHSAPGWPRRLRRPLPRGGSHRALRQRRPGAAIRVSVSGRQLGDGGLCVPPRAPDPRPDLDRGHARPARPPMDISTTSARAS